VFDPLTGHPVMVSNVTGSTDFIWSPSSVLLGSISTTGPPQLFGSDRQGSITETFDTTGHSLWRGAYGPTGERATISGTAPRFGFTAGEHDSTGLVYLTHRFLDPTHGWFTQTDPLPNPFGTSAIGGYVYANAEPTRLVDPSGLRAETNCGRGVLLTVATNGAFGGIGSGCSLADVAQDILTDGRRAEAVLNAVVKHAIVPLVVGALCEAVTAGVGTIGCFVVAGMAGRAADNLMAGKPAFQGVFSLKAITRDAAIGILTMGVGTVLGRARAALKAGAAERAALREAEQVASSEASNVIDNVENISGATNTVAVPIESGNYVVSTPAGEYVGQSGNISTRLEQHVASGKFTQAEVDAAQRFAVQGTKLDREIAEQLLIDSKGGIDNLLNKVNPIGPKRFGLMPNQPYVR
jgi:RHS repeat-associated protein